MYNCTEYYSCITVDVVKLQQVHVPVCVLWSCGQSGQCRYSYSPCKESLLAFAWDSRASLMSMNGVQVLSLMIGSCLRCWTIEQCGLTNLIFWLHLLNYELPIIKYSLDFKVNSVFEASHKQPIVVCGSKAVLMLLIRRIIATFPVHLSCKVVWLFWWADILFRFLWVPVMKNLFLSLEFQNPDIDGLLVKIT